VIDKDPTNSQTIARRFHPGREKVRRAARSMHKLQIKPDEAGGIASGNLVLQGRRQGRWVAQQAIERARERRIALCGLVHSSQNRKAEPTSKKLWQLTTAAFGLLWRPEN
jgi:hypothetical protein